MPKASGVTGYALPSFCIANMASADFSLRHSSLPFQARGEISPGKGRGLRCTIAGSTPSAFGRENFTYPGTLVLARSALYPVSVRRLTASAPRFFQCQPRGRCHFTLRLARGPYDQVPRRTFTSWSRPCWAHLDGPGPLSTQGSHGPGRARFQSRQRPRLLLGNCLKVIGVELERSQGVTRVFATEALAIREHDMSSAWLRVGSQKDYPHRSRRRCTMNRWLTP